jgi:hypothetical protein
MLLGLKPGHTCDPTPCLSGVHLLICITVIVSKTLKADGLPKDAAARMLNQLPKQLTELEWMAVAMKKQRDTYGHPNY